jgi:hypothetical protein
MILLANSSRAPRVELSEPTSGTAVIMVGAAGLGRPSGNNR